MENNLKSESPITIDYYIDEDNQIFLVTDDGLISIEAFVRDADQLCELMQRIRRLQEESHISDAPEQKVPGKLLYAYTSTGEIAMVGKRKALITAQQLAADRDEILQKTEGYRSILRAYYAAKEENDSLFSSNEEGFMDFAKSLLSSYRAYKYGDYVKTERKNKLTQEDLRKNIEALNEDDTVEDMLTSVGLLGKASEPEDMMVWLPSQDLSLKSWNDPDRISVSSLVDIYAAAAGGKKAETRFSRIGPQSFALANKLVSLIEASILLMEKSQNLQESKCAKVLIAEYINFETMDTLDENGNRSAMTYEDLAKELGISRRTYINQKEQGISFFARRCFDLMLENRQEYDNTLQLIMSKENRQKLKKNIKKKNRGADLPRKESITILED